MFSPLRLDLCVKFLYARAILDNRREDLFERLYVRHVLMRTGGSEPVDGITCQPSDKRSVADYLRAFRELIHSIRDNGYDPAHPVPVMDNGRIGNGAHRLAACRALGVPVAVSRHSGDCGTWDFDWFVRKGFALPDLQRILHCWVALDDRAIVVVLWPSVRTLWRQLIELCREQLTLVGAVTLDCHAMGRPAFDSLILDLYANENPDHADGLRNIERKCDLLANHPAELQVVVLTPGPHTPADFSMTTLKARMRNYADAVAATEDFITCHASASPAEARHMADTLLCPEYLAAVALRRHRKPRPEFLAWLNNYDRCLSEQQLNHHDCCVVGSSPLEVTDIRLSTDIDFALRESIRDGRYPLGPVNLSQDVDIVSRGYHRSNRRPWISDDELAANPDWHFRFRGRSFAGIDIVRDRKDFSRRPKDCADVARIDALRSDPVYGAWLHELVEVDGRRGGNLAQFAIEGWSKTESWGTWSDGEIASLLLPAPRLSFEHIALHVRMVAIAPEGVEQGVQVTVNAIPVGDWRAEQGAVIERRLHIPATAIDGKARFRLGFRIEAPHSPGLDKRRLGVGLITLTLKSAAPQTQAISPAL
ncbi:MAG: hypothetical protein ACM31D_11190 [Bacteroidota bacterium]